LTGTTYQATFGIVSSALLAKHAEEKYPKVTETMSQSIVSVKSQSAEEAIPRAPRKVEQVKSQRQKLKCRRRNIKSPKKS
jgi:phage shock protein A